MDKPIVSKLAMGQQTNPQILQIYSKYDGPELDRRSTGDHQSDKG